MAMNENTLADELINLAPAATEAEAIANFTAAYATYCTDAVAAGPILPAGIDLGVAAMEAALVGMNAPGASAAVMSAGLVAFWAAVALGLTTSFAGATAIVPPAGLATVGPIIQAVFDANIAAMNSLEDSAAALAAAINAATVPGGSVSIGAVTTVIT